MGYEEVSKAYRAYDTEADQVVISCDVNFDESTFGFSPTLLQQLVDDTALDFESMNIIDQPCTMQLKQAGKQKGRSNSQEQAFQRTLSARRGARLEEASAPDDVESRQAKRQQALKPIWTKSAKTATKIMMKQQHPQVFWRASVNAVEGADLSEPTTLQGTIGGPDQVHWRKAICAELDPMKLHGVFERPNCQPDNTQLALREYSRSSARLMDRLRSARNVSWQKDSSKNMVLTTRRRFPQYSST